MTKNRPAKFLYLLVCLSLWASSEGLGQGFNTFSGRNYPEVEWISAETPNFLITYPARIAGIEAEAAAIAEHAYAVLSENLRVDFDRRIRIYLSDKDEIVNGFAVPVGNGHTNIWVNLNDVARYWTGEEKWLRTVIPHELAHIFHFRAIRSNIGLLGFALADPIPIFWAEGLAQYQTESWNAIRGDNILRIASLENRLDYNDGVSLRNNQLMYAVGNSQVRFFAEQYGDSTLADMLRHRRRMLFGLARVHDFRVAFRETTGRSYQQFRESWQRHTGIYYNTLAAGMEPPDSLASRPVGLPPQYYVDVRYNHDASLIAAIGVTSLAEPVRRLYVVTNDSARTHRTVAEGMIQPGIAWHPSGARLAFSRQTRAEYGALVNDLYVVDIDGTNRRRLTYGRRASNPSFSPDGYQLAFVSAPDGTGNIYLLDIETGFEQRITDFTSDVQIGSIRWRPGYDQIAVSVFDDDGSRYIALIDLEDRSLIRLTDGRNDDRTPAWSTTGDRVAYTSLRDDVPNVFVRQIDDDGNPRDEMRVTHVTTGASVLDWLPPRTNYGEGRLAIASTDTKRRDHLYLVDPDRSPPGNPALVPVRYSTWTAHRPPARIPPAIAADPSLILDRYAYESWRNISHVVSLALPYYAGSENWGAYVMTGWTEPLGMHSFSLIGALSLPEPRSNSFFISTYVNNQFRPTFLLSAYRIPRSARAYGSSYLVETYTGGDITGLLPVDWFDTPYLNTYLMGTARYAHISPLNPDVMRSPPALPAPESGYQAELQFNYTMSRIRPYHHNVIHPLSAAGLRLQLTAGIPLQATNNRFLRPEIAGYTVIPAPGRSRIYAYARAIMQVGESRPQDYVGLSRYDEISLKLFDGVPFRLGDAERVRGYREYVMGNRLLFGTIEYRVPFLPDLRTRLLGVISLGKTTISAFSDGALVWQGGKFDDASRRAGVGIEAKNALSIGGFRVLHALGIAQPAHSFGEDSFDLYYRLRTTIPF